jgi:nicotinate-nucleotide adenylyltransferase
VRTGILGGTFDPIHLGHIAAARAAVDCAGLDRVLFIPTGTPPHRRGTVASPEQRLEMCRLAVGDGEPFEVSDVEVRRGGVSYTADTLKQLKALHPDDELFLILGWDAARLFRTWHIPAEVRRLARVVIVTRPGTVAPDTAAIEAAGLDPATSSVCVRPTPDISASGLRRDIAHGQTVTDRLPEPVAAYIAKNKLYMDNRQVGR